MKRFFVLTAAAGYLALVSLVPGCRRSSNAQMPTGPSVQEQVQRIRNDPSMPPQAKAVAIQQITGRQGGTAGGGAK